MLECCSCTLHVVVLYCCCGCGSPVQSAVPLKCMRMCWTAAVTTLSSAAMTAAAGGPVQGLLCVKHSAGLMLLWVQEALCWKCGVETGTRIWAVADTTTCNTVLKCCATEVHVVMLGCCWNQHFCRNHCAGVLLGHVAWRCVGLVQLQLQRALCWIAAPNRCMQSRTAAVPICSCAACCLLGSPQHAATA